jgi:hypothetical protein
LKGFTKMSINYYWIEEEIIPCLWCGRSDRENRLHIGLSARGWCFQLHVHQPGDNELLPKDYNGWQELFKQRGSYIVDKYGDKVKPKEMIDIITNREGVDRPKDYDYARNQAVLGPNKLLRARIDNIHCVAHGEGTWDCIVGDFS